TAELPPLPLHDALPIWSLSGRGAGGAGANQGQHQQRRERDGSKGAARVPLQFGYSHIVESGRRHPVVQPLAALFGIVMGSSVARSEEHTSELQSRENLV